ncbi:MAG: hypothetical protein VYA34_07880 [Myxococcota bacterium]|nr:hypothetical protein [Myxococcota bacterium]
MITSPMFSPKRPDDTLAKPPPTTTENHRYFRCSSCQSSQQSRRPLLIGMHLRIGCQCSDRKAIPPPKASARNEKETPMNVAFFQLTGS